MKHTTTIAALLLTAALSGCQKEQADPNRKATYWVQCDSCRVTYAGPGTTTSVVGWDWKYNFTAQGEQPLSIQAVNLLDTGTVMVAIQIDGVMVNNDFSTWPDSVSTISTDL